MIPRLPLIVLCCLLALLGSHAKAQEANANDILDASRVAIQELSGFSAQFRMRGEGGAMFADTLPSMSGQLFFGTHEELGRVIHCIGEARDQQKTPSQAIDILIANDRYLWTDIQARKIIERPVSGSSRGLPSAFPLVLMKSILSDDPYAKDANNSESIELLAQEMISNELCDVIHIKRSKPDARSKRSGSDAYTDARWYIGVEDKLPRKLEHITDAGLVKITLVFELSTLRVIDPSPSQLDVSRPAGFVFESRMPKPKPNQPTEVIESSEQPTPTTPVEVIPSVQFAPQYAFTTAAGTQINNATQDGRITVLYFWGSWCVPCKTASPLVSTLAQNFANDPVDVFGLAIREADPDQTRTDFNSLSYHYAISLDANPLVSSFKIRVYPTIVVITPAGEIVFQQGISKKVSSEDLVVSVKEAVQSAIDAN